MRQPRKQGSVPVPTLPSIFEKVIGLDLSLVSTGVAHIEHGCVTAGTFRSKDKGTTRLVSLNMMLVDYISKNPPVAAAVEGYSFGSRANQHSIGEWGGIAKMRLKLAGIPTLIVPPATLKKFLTGKGNADPSSIPLYLFKHWGIEVPQNDMADAVGLAIMALAWQFPSKVALTQYQEEAIARSEVMT